MQIELLENPSCFLEKVSIVFNPTLKSRAKAWWRGVRQPQPIKRDFSGRKTFNNIKITCDDQLELGNKYKGDFESGIYIIHNFIPIKKLDIGYECAIDYFTIR